MCDALCDIDSGVGVRETLGEGRVPANIDKPDQWAADTAASVEMYNEWFIRFAPEAFRSIRARSADEVENALVATNGLRDVTARILKLSPRVIAALRMATCPPVAVDRLVGISGAKSSVVDALECGRLPLRLSEQQLDVELNKITDVITKMADVDICPWLLTGADPTAEERHRAATIIADRLCAAIANPIIRNAQEERQLALVSGWLQARGYALSQARLPFNQMLPGTFSFRTIVPVVGETGQTTNIPVDAVVMPRGAADGDFPILIEAKSAGDFTNVNKRRKEEAVKAAQLRRTYGDTVVFALFLCGYFGKPYLEYEAAEGIDWVWEHRPDDLAALGL